MILNLILIMTLVSFFCQLLQCLAATKKAGGGGGGPLEPLPQEVILRRSQSLNSPPTAQRDGTACVITSHAADSFVSYSGVSGSWRSVSFVLRPRWPVIR